MQTKQVILIRNDLNMRKGKMVAQGAHASECAIFDGISNGTLTFSDNGLQQTTSSEDDPVNHWYNNGFRKIVVQVSSEEELKNLIQIAKDQNLLHSLITDSGYTEFNGVPTITAGAIGPWISDTIDEITKHLKLF